jgi:hypothetical protein
MQLGQVSLSLPAVINREGIARVPSIPLSASERQALETSAEILKKHIALTGHLGLHDRARGRDFSLPSVPVASRKSKSATMRLNALILIGRFSGLRNFGSSAIKRKPESALPISCRQRWDKVS